MTLKDNVTNFSYEFNFFGVKECRKNVKYLEEDTIQLKMRFSEILY